MRGKCTLFGVAIAAAVLLFWGCEQDINLTVPVITITAQPAASTVVTEGSVSGSLTVSAAATEGKTPAYQWYSNTSNTNTGGTAIAGATESTFTIPTTLKAGTYYYFCEVSAEGASAQRSNAVAVTVTPVGAVLPVITITAQPQAVTVTEGHVSGSVTVSASVTEGKTLKYQWYSNTSNSNSGGAVISGATGASYTIPTTLKAGTHYYFCEITADGASSKRSAVAAVSVNPPGVVTPVITITAQPQAVTVNEGSISGSVTVSATVTEGKTLKYQWYSNTINSNSGGTVITGAAGASYTIPATLKGGTYYYFCEVSAEGASAQRSNAAAVTVKGIPVITITTQPRAVTVNEGNITDSLTVSATVTDGKTPKYQWYANTTNSNSGGEAITGAAGASYAIPTVLTTGTYYYFCEVTADGASSKRSAVAAVTVAPPVPVITITAQPKDVTVTAGGASDTLTVAATVTLGKTLKYQWYSNDSNSYTGGRAVAGATEAAWTISSAYIFDTLYYVEGQQSYYFCEISADGAASIRSNIAALTVLEPVITITEQPRDITVNEGSTDSLTAGATVTGGITLQYQWYSKTSINGYGTLISEATEASYTIPATLKPGTHYYYCVARVSVGRSWYSEISETATVTVKGIPTITITAQTKDAALIEGSISGSLTVTASVTEGRTPVYQWYSNTTNSNSGGTAIDGAAEASYAIPTALEVGTYYYCEITADGAETKRSETVSVTVNGTTVIVIQPMDDPDLIEQAIEAAADTDTVFTITGTGYTAYQWRVDGEIQDADGAAYTFNRPAGTYELMVVATGGGGLRYSGSCRVTVR